ncbi:transcription factor, putative [Ricinus communis]|uniref:Transcription factor, putative n=1 Tax=Ricinus communis TaxID=3988 RepID=B9RXX2_RICCO|nr:transcription factor, putative [Ricinus communis]|eukprot:XP_002518591.1 transcription factor bHLH112 isoform X1 [Ricinus communis]
MAEEFQTGICGGNWWSLSKNMFMGGSSPCSAGHDLGSTYGSWLVSDMVDHLKPRSSISCKDSTNINTILVSDHNSVVFQDSHKPQQQSDSDHSGGSSSILMDNSTLQMMSFGISSSSSSSSPSSDWSCQTLLRGNGRGESYNSMLQEDMNTPGLNNTSQIQKDWSPKSFTSIGEDSTINAYKATNQDFSLDHQQQQRLNHPTTCQNLSTSFPMGSSSASYGYPATVIQGLYEPDPQPQPQQQQQQQSLFSERTMNYASPSNYGTILNELSPSWSKLAPYIRPSLPKQQQQPAAGGGLHFSNNTPFWNPSGSATALNDIKASFVQSNNSQPQYLMPTFEEKPNCPNVTLKPNNEQVRDSGSVVKKGSEPAIKRARIETPSPLPTFKVRKEKLGDRITALQQLVSPFGKTDTASVLHEAIEYIKFLHDQVSVLSTPYMKNGNPIQHQQAEKLKETEGLKQDLKSRGLCLVPISSTFPVANETTVDFWTPTFGGTFR